MLTIRKAQMEALTYYIQNDFREWLFQALKQKSSENPESFMCEEHKFMEIIESTLRAANAERIVFAPDILKLAINAATNVREDKL
jgi:hypothetical protein